MKKTIYILVGLLLMSVAAAYAQPTISGFLPAKSVYCPGESITIYGTDLYEPDCNPCATGNCLTPAPGCGPCGSPCSCDSMRLDDGGSLVFGFIPGLDYTGFDGPTDSVFWTIPATLPAGVYDMAFDDDNDCNNASSNFGPTMSITIESDTADVSFPVGPNYCLGDTNPKPVSLGDPGTWSSATPNLVSTGGEVYIHSGVLGVHTITFTTNGTCFDIVNFPVIIDSIKPSAYGFANSTYCRTAGVVPADTLPSPQAANNTFFSSIPSGVIFTDAFGSIDVTNSPPGVYAVIYTPHPDSCAASVTDFIEIIEPAQALFNYDTLYCNNDTVKLPNVTFVPSGYFAEANSNPNITVDSTTGAIDLINSQVGTYVIEFVPTDTCFINNTDTFVIVDPPSLQFSYPTAYPCIGDSFMTPTIVDSGGTFHVYSGGLVVDDTTGVLDLRNATLGGPWPIYYVDRSLPCPDSTVFFVNIRTSQPVSVSYDSAACQNAGNLLPNFTLGATGGTFGSTTGGVNFVNNNTGEINLSASVIGTHQLWYVKPDTGCPDTVFLTLPLVIDTVPDATFDFPDDFLCKNSGDYPFAFHNSDPPIAQWDFIEGGVINANGIFQDTLVDTDFTNLGGPHEIRCIATIGACRDTFSDYVSIVLQPLADISYPTDTFCTNNIGPVPAILGTSGGTFFASPSTPTTVVNDSTGQINTVASGAGTHCVHYAVSTGGICHDTSSWVNGVPQPLGPDCITIQSALAAEFSYPRTQACQTDGLLIPSVYPAIPGGVFISDTGLTITPDSGVITLATSTPGNHQVTYDLPDTGSVCQSDFTITIIVVGSDDTTQFFYNPDTYCPSDSFATPTLVGDTTGTFLASVGLVFSDQVTGEISIHETLPQSYEVKYLLPGACNQILLDTIFITQPDDPTFSYPNPSYCVTDPDPTPNPVVPGGTYAASGVGNLVFADNQGTIDLSATDAGNYTINYTTPGAGSCAADTSITMTILPGPANISFDPFPNDSICEGEEVLFIAAGGATYDIKLNGVVKSFSDQFAIDTLRDTDTMTAVINNSVGCSDSISIVMTVFPFPQTILPDTEQVVSGLDPIMFDVGANVDNTTFFWRVIDTNGDVTFSTADSTIGPVNANQFTQLIHEFSVSSFLTPADITYEIIPTSELCTGTERFAKVKINPQGLSIFIPEVITPNGDGDNDLWQIQWWDEINPDEFSINLFNRSGGCVECNMTLQAATAFDGLTYPDGVYWWQLMDLSGNVVEAGGLTIRRK